MLQCWRATRGRAQRTSQGQSRQGDGDVAVHRRPAAARDAVRRHRAVDHPARADHRPPGTAPPWPRRGRLSRHSRPQRRRAHHRRPAVPGRTRSAARGRAGAAAGPRRPRPPGGRGWRGHAGLPAVDRAVRPARVAVVVQGHRHRQGGHRRRVPRRGRGRRRRVPHGASGAALHRDQRRHRRAVDRCTRCAAQRPRHGHDGLRVAAVPVLRAQGAGGGPRPRPVAGPRRADGDRRRLRRQGRVPVGVGVPCRHPGRQGRRSGEDDLRPRRRPAGHDQAPSGDRPPPHRRDTRRPAHRDGHRRGDGCRSLLHP
jgi:hypothetical protein